MPGPMDQQTRAALPDGRHLSDGRSETKVTLTPIGRSLHTTIWSGSPHSISPRHSPAIRSNVGPWFIAERASGAGRGNRIMAASNRAFLDNNPAALLATKAAKRKLLRISVYPNAGVGSNTHKGPSAPPGADHRTRPTSPHPGRLQRKQAQFRRTTNPEPQRSGNSDACTGMKQSVADAM